MWRLTLRGAPPKMAWTRPHTAAFRRSQHDSKSRHERRNKELEEITMASTDIVIVAATRTPVGSFNGAFASMPAHVLGAAAINGALERAGVAPEEVDEVILGQVLTAAEGQNPARQAAMKAGIPVDKTAWSLN